MVRTGSTNKLPVGIEPRKNCIRINFPWRLKRCRGTLHIAPTAPNIKYAARLKEDIMRRIAQGTFEIGDFFPDHPLANVEKTNPTFREISNIWLLSKQDLAKSTKESYSYILNAYFMA